MLPGKPLSRYMTVTHIITFSTLAACGLLVTLLLLNPMKEEAAARIRVDKYTKERSNMTERVFLFKTLLQSLSPHTSTEGMRKKTAAMPSTSSFLNQEEFFLGDAEGNIFAPGKNTIIRLVDGNILNRAHIAHIMKQANNKPAFFNYTIQLASNTPALPQLGCLLWLTKGQVFIGTGRSVMSIEAEIQHHVQPLLTRFNSYRTFLWGCILLAAVILFIRCRFFALKIRKETQALNSLVASLEKGNNPDKDTYKLSFREFLKFAADAEGIQKRLKRSLTQLERMLDEKGALLKEVHHRAKNNFQIVSCIFDAQAAGIKDPAIHSLLERCNTRIRTIALTHEQIYNAPDLANVDMQEYLESMMLMLSQHPHSREGVIACTLDTEKVLMHLENAIPCGLLLGELIDNAYTHAFPRELTGSITITLRGPGRENPNHFLSVEDDGYGLPAEVDPFNTDSIGFTLVRLLTSQLRGELVISSGPEGKGTKVTITFP